jgi:N-acetylglucosaminyl-diphospho-decaprenol L-rhamnosyltransferase
VVTHTGGHATSRVAAAMVAEHHRALYRYLARQYAGPRYALLRPALAMGLFLRYLLARGVKSVGEGAAPTRSADVLES